MLPDLDSITTITIHHRVAVNTVANPTTSTDFALNLVRVDALIHISTGTNLQPRRYINTFTVRVCVRGPPKSVGLVRVSA